jgi:hypothetical protein
VTATITNLDRGTVPGDGNGDTAYIAAGVINTNFANVNTALALVEGGYVGQSIQTGASYGLILTDAGLPVELTHTAACGIVIPADSVISFPINTRIDLVQGGAGLLTVTITDDTLRGNAVSYGIYKSMSLWKKSATVWYVFGGTT